MDNYLFVEQTTSTNSQLASLLKEPLKEGFILQTNFQVKGKGQGLNSWESEMGKNLLFSILLYPNFMHPAKQFLLSKAVAVAIVNVLNGMKKGFQVKWPNDIYYADKKLAGILIETAIMGATLKHAIFGIGINVNQEEFKKAPNPVSLKQILGKVVHIPTLLSELKASILKEYVDLSRGNVESISYQYEANLFRKSGVWKFKEDDEVFEASITSVEDDGRLILKTTNHEIRKYWIKEVEFLF